MLALLVLAGCPSGGAPWFLADADHDGASVLVDCDDHERSVYPGAPEIAGDGVDQDCDGADRPAGTSRSGTGIDDAFGAALAAGPDAPYVGAPMHGGVGLAAGRVYAGSTPVLDGAPGDRLGAALAALSDGTLLVGAPGVDEVRELGGAVVYSAAGAGAALTARGQNWATSTRSGAHVGPDRDVAWGAAPFALALDAQGRVWGGFPRATIAVRGESATIAAPDPTAEAGYALLLADVDADGREDLVVGAPGEGAVYVLDPTAPPASLSAARRIEGRGGRFGAALASPGPGILYVGAPMAEGARGAVWRVSAPGDPVELYTGDPDDQLGYALLCTADGLLHVGAPGSPTGSGAVVSVAP